MRTRTLFPLALVAVAASAAGAQGPTSGPILEVRPFAGVYVPTGAMADAFKTATMLGAQGALELSRHLHLLGSVGWTHGHSKLVVGNDRTNIWQYDLGAEANLVRPVGGGWMLRPFAGAGAGARTYDYRAAGVNTRTCTAGYGALGSELQSGGVAVRLEGRSYWSCFKSPATGRNATRNDLGVTLGLAYHLR